MFRKALSPLNKFLLNLKLRQKLLLSYLILIVIPLGIFTLFSDTTVNNIMKKQIIFSANRAFDQASEFINYKINKVIKVSDVIALDNTVNSTLEKKLESYSLPNQYEDMKDLRNYLDSFADKTDGLEIRLYVRDELVYSRGNYDLYGFSDAIHTMWYSELMKSSTTVLMCPSFFLENGGAGDNKILSVARRLKESDDYSVTLAYLRVDFREADIRKILSDANTVPGSLTYLQNSQGLTVSSTDDNLMSKFKVEPSIANQLQGLSDWSTKNINNEQTYIKVRAVPNTDWSMVTVIPLKNIFSDIVKLRNDMFLLLIIVGTIAYLTAVYISYNITKRIGRLIKRMKVVQSGSLENVTILVDSADEIGELTQDYNYMIQRIGTLAEEQYKSGQELKGAELRALQAQINPHFLYNTLDMINWMSYQDKGPEIRSLVKSLSEFYKLSLNNGRDIVSINDELTHASLYVQIQNVRLNNKIHFIVDVDDAIKEHKIIKITLQPIIENAIIHGIMNKQEKEGTIRVHAEIAEDTIIITVEDDGVGMKPERVNDILSDSFLAEQNHGFGIRNIHDRIRLFFGAEYGLTIKSEYNRGTTVSIRIPTNAKK